MDQTFLMRSVLPDAITSAAKQPDAAALSLEEVRICFPTRIAMFVDGEECLVLEDAPVIGVLVDIAECWLRLRSGAPSAEAVDFYGEYKLVLRKVGGSIECVNEFGGGQCLAPSEVFRAAAQRCSEEAFAGLEGRYPDIIHNPNYARLKAHVLNALHGNDLPQTLAFASARRGERSR